MRFFLYLQLALVLFNLPVSAGEALPTLSWVQWSRIKDDAETFTAKVEKVEQRILYKNEVVQEELEVLEARLLKLLETEGEALKEFVKFSCVVTTIELRITESHSGKKKVGDLVTVVVTDSVGDLCPHSQAAPNQGGICG